VSLEINLDGRLAWITGGASGIGAAVVATFTRAGARVVSLDVSYPCLDLAARPVIQVPLDVRDTVAVEATCATLISEGHSPDILVNNAGIARDSVVWKMTDEQWAEVVDVNLTGAFRMTRACAPALREKRGSAIVNVASITALRGHFGQANYAASKGGLIAFTKAVARELARERVRVNAVAPGFIETPLTRDLAAKVLDDARGQALLGHLGQPQDVANAVLFLASPLAAHITGEVLVVDGGQVA
jgi:3-oxoacyl-[acyl-carrier protein] reductase